MWHERGNHRQSDKLKGSLGSKMKDNQTARLQSSVAPNKAANEAF